MPTGLGQKLRELSIQIRRVTVSCGCHVWPCPEPASASNTCCALQHPAIPRGMHGCCSWSDPHSESGPSFDPVHGHTWSSFPLISANSIFRRIYPGHFSFLPFLSILFCSIVSSFFICLFSSTYAEGLRIVLVSRVSILPLCVCPRRATRFPEEEKTKKNERIGKTTEWKRTEGWVTSEPQKSSAVADRKFKAENRCSPPSCCLFVKLVNVYGSCPGDIFPFNVTSPVSPALKCSTLLIK